MRSALRNKLKELPDLPGIYLFLDEDGTPLYVGKAKSLRKRVANYSKKGDDVRLATMVDEACDLDYVVTDSEAGALLLENTYIKRHQPRFNIRLRDDKTYPYLKLTMADEYPRLAFTRRIRSDGAEYFGPFLPGGLARRAIKIAQKLFQVRVCRIEIDGTLPRPCLYHDMKRCLGPCVDGLTTRADYSEAVEQCRLFLAGKTDVLLRDLKQNMEAASARLDYEGAARVRDVIFDIESVSRRQQLSTGRGEDVDIYGLYAASGHAAVTSLIMRNGQVLDRRELFFEGLGPVAPARLLSELLPQIYDVTTFVPSEIHLPLPIDGEDALVEWLSEKRGGRVYLRMPSRGPKAERVSLAMQNARLAYRRRFRLDSGVHQGALALQEHLGLDGLPERIEGFDVSTFHGAETVASLVVWQSGRMNKRDYRSFNIRGLEGPDDFASIRQAVHRRYRRVLEEVGDMPDLILIDGGRGQLNAALAALAELGVEDTPIVGLAKREEEIYSPAVPEPRRLPRADAGLRLLQQVRDEAHRFAVSRHRRRRDRKTLRSGFDDLRGVGEKRRKALVRRFGSYRGVKQATLEELCSVLGPALGQRVYDQLHAAPEPEPVAASAKGGTQDRVRSSTRDD